MDITFDFSGLFSDRLGVGNGIEESEIHEMIDRVYETHDKIMGLKGGGKPAFYDIPETMIHDVKTFELGERIRGEFSDMVILGIGGSALGTKALYSALGGEGKGVRLHIVDNIDPFSFSQLLSVIDLEKTIFDVVSKSGTTAETNAQFIIVRNLLEERLGKNWKRHILITTDPKRGHLRRLVNEEELESLPIQEELGGRYSVFSAVGLLPMIAAGIDGRQLLGGALEMKRFCLTPDLERNPAYLNGLLHALGMMNHGIDICVMMPYCDRLITFSEWFAQLWAESLGKKGMSGEEVVRYGQTPLCAKGATDQHSLLQLFMDGPKDKVITFIEVTKNPYDLEFRVPEWDEENLYLDKRNMSELFLNEKKGTELALTEAGVMNMTITLPTIDPWTLGELFFFYELSTAWTGLFLGIDPFDQPGVERGKLFTKFLMGKEVGGDVKESIEALLTKGCDSKGKRYRYIQENR